MKHLLLSVHTILLAVVLQAQCPDCTADVNCVSQDGFPTICPQELSAATTGEYYEEALTFYLPATIVDPETSITADLLEVSITSVTGLPFGMAYSLDDEDGIYMPSEGQTLGCATVCGTPLLPGQYTVQISVVALVAAFGSTFEQLETFSLPLTVLEGPGGTDSFTATPLAGCGSLTAAFEATLSGSPAQHTHYSWNFGNGQTSFEAGPHTIGYTEPGVYEVSLNTVISNRVLQRVELFELAALWGNDIDEFFGAGNPDPYFRLLDADGMLAYQSATLSDVQVGSWDVSVSLSNPPYTIHIWDEDAVTQDDFLGSFELGSAPGEFPFETESGTEGSTMLGLIQINNITSSAEVNVFPAPTAALAFNGGVFSCTGSSAGSYQWIRNGEPVEEAQSCTLVPEEGGQYQLQVTNEYGCQAVTEPYLHCPGFSLIYNPGQDVLLAPQGFQTYTWYLNGELVEGSDSYTFSDPPNGQYQVLVTTSYGCETWSQETGVMVGVTEQNDDAWTVYPQPAGEVLYVDVQSEEPALIRLLDTQGRVLREFSAERFPAEVDVSGLSGGICILQVAAGHQVLRRSILVR
jgi:hypothetical protein